MFSNRASLIFGQGPEQLEHLLTHWRRSVHIFRQPDKLHALGFQILKKLSRSLRLPPLAVQPPDYKLIVLVLHHYVGLLPRHFSDRPVEGDLVPKIG